MGDPLIPILEKVGRAETHIHKLERRVERFLDANPYRLEAEPWTERGQISLRVYILHEPPAVELGVVVGDAVHDLRSALDQLVWALTVQRQRRLPKDPLPNNCWWSRVSFPIYIKPWSTRYPPGCRGVDPDLWFALRDVQPFAAGKAKPNRDPLWLLRELWNWDKHRAVPLVLGRVAFQLHPEVAALSRIFPDVFPGLRPQRVENIEGPVEDGQVIVVLEGLQVTAASLAEVKQHLNEYGRLSFDITFAKGPPAYGASLRRTLRQMHARVGDIVALLGPFVRDRIGRYPHHDCPPVR